MKIQFSVFNTGHKKKLVSALQKVLSDDSFKVTCKLLGSLKGIIKASVTKALSYNTVKTWRKFFLPWSSPEFVTQWKTLFLKPLDEPVELVLFQHLTDLVFHICLNYHLKVMHKNKQVSSEDLELRATEKGILYYIAGFICRQLQKKFDRESHEYKEEMVLCFMELVKDQHLDSHKPGSQLKTDFEHWTDLIDRGGLWHIKDMTYRLFFAIEQVIREVLMAVKHLLWPLKENMIKK